MNQAADLTPTGQLRLHKRNRLTLILGLLMAVLSGMGAAVQSKVNGLLGAELDDAVTASLFSFASGWVICVLVFFVTVNHARASLVRLVAGLREGHLPWWALIGGFAGAVFVFAQSSIVTLVGLAGFTIAIVAGTTIGGIVMDSLGVSGVIRRLNFLRGLGAVITLIAVLLMVSRQLQFGSDWWLLILPFTAGILTTFQQATIGLVRHETRSFTLASLVSFTAGTTLLLVIWLGTTAVNGLPEQWPENPLLYVGGILGFIFILVIALTVRRIGVLLLTLAMTAGQLIASLVIDLLYPDAFPVNTLSYIAVTLAMIGVTVAVLGLRSSRSRVKVHAD